MSTPIATLEQIRALARTSKDHVVLVRARPVWEGPAQIAVGQRTATLVAAPTVLAVRAAIAEHRSDDLLVVLTDRTEQELGLDVLARVSRQHVRRLDPWELVRAELGVSALDPHLAVDRCVLDALVQHNPATGSVKPPGWFLRDYHSPNLMWLADRDGLGRVGIIDYQDALAESCAYDLLCLLQDNRLDVPAALEAELLDYYCLEVTRREPGFDEAHFRSIYAAFGAERHTRIVGLWIRLLRRDQKPGYLKHMARAWAYLTRNLAHPDLSTLRQWYDTHLPPELRNRTSVP